MITEGLGIGSIALLVLFIWWTLVFSLWAVGSFIRIGTGYLWHTDKIQLWASKIAKESSLNGCIRVLNRYDIGDTYILGSVMCGMALAVMQGFFSRYINWIEVAQTFHVLGYGVLLWLCWLIAKAIRDG
jgi:hypothetical protein